MVIMQKGDAQTSKKGGRKKMETISRKIFREICPHCAKEIVSLNEKQLEYNFKAHLISCKKKNEK